MLRAFVIVGLCIFSCTSYAESQERIIGGFGAPQFFSKYDKQAIDEIAKTPNAKSVRITYPHALKSLALQIKHELMKKSEKSKANSVKSLKINIEELNLEDTPTTKYRHDAVVVVVYFRE